MLSLFFFFFFFPKFWPREVSVVSIPLVDCFVATSRTIEWKQSKLNLVNPANATNNFLQQRRSIYYFDYNVVWPLYVRYIRAIFNWKESVAKPSKLYLLFYAHHVYLKKKSEWNLFWIWENWLRSSKNMLTFVENQQQQKIATRKQLTVEKKKYHLVVYLSKIFFLSFERNRRIKTINTK